MRFLFYPPFFPPVGAITELDDRPSGRQLFQQNKVVNDDEDALLAAAEGEIEEEEFDMKTGEKCVVCVCVIECVFVFCVFFSVCFGCVCVCSICVWCSCLYLYELDLYCICILCISCACIFYIKCVSMLYRCYFRSNIGSRR